MGSFIIDELGPNSSIVNSKKPQTSSIYSQLEYLLVNARPGDVYQNEVAQFYDTIKDKKDTRRLKVHTLLSQFTAGSLEPIDFYYNDDWFVQAVGTYLHAWLRGTVNYSRFMSASRTLDLLSIGNETDPAYHIVKTLSFQMLSQAANYSGDIEQYVKYGKKVDRWTTLKNERASLFINAAIMHYKHFHDGQALHLINSVDKNDPAIVNQLSAVNFIKARLLLMEGQYDEAIDILQNSIDDKVFQDSHYIYPLLATAYAAKGERKKANNYINLSRDIIFKNVRATIFIRNTELFLSIFEPTAADLARFQESLKVSYDILQAERYPLHIEFQNSD